MAVFCFFLLFCFVFLCVCSFFLFYLLGSDSNSLSFSQKMLLLLLRLLLCAHLYAGFLLLRFVCFYFNSLFVLYTSMVLNDDSHCTHTLERRNRDCNGAHIPYLLCVYSVDTSKKNTDRITIKKYKGGNGDNGNSDEPILE